MNILLFDPDQLSDDHSLKVTGRQHDHLRTVLNAAPGDTVRVGAVNGNTGLARVIAVGADATRLRVELRDQPPPPLPLTLVLALPRPKMMRRILQTLASLGVKEIHLVNSVRVEKSFWQTPWLQPDSIRENFLLGLEQSGDTRLPALHLHRRFKPFVEDELPRIASASTALVAHPRTATDCPRDLDGPVTLAVGPEGGFIDYEVDKLRDCGFQAVSLGPRILRVETAIPVLVASLFASL